MITETEIGHIIFDDCRFLGLPIYLKDTLSEEYKSGEDRIEEQGRVVIRPKTVTNDKTYFNDCTVEVNIALPDVDGEKNPNLEHLYAKALRVLDDDKCGRYREDFYRYSVQRHGIERESGLNCHYANITLLFEILNVRRKEYGKAIYWR